MTRKVTPTRKGGKGTRPAEVAPELVSDDPAVHARAALEHATFVSMLTGPGNHDALETIKTALLVMLGKREAELPPLDTLDRLKNTAWNLPQKANDADLTYRMLAELVENCCRRLHRERRVRTLPVEAKRLRQAVVDALGEDWRTLSADDFAALLARWTPRRPGRGQLSTNGVVRELATRVLPGTHTPQAVYGAVNLRQ